METGFGLESSQMLICKFFFFLTINCCMIKNKNKKSCRYSVRHIDKKTKLIEEIMMFI